MSPRAMDPLTRPRKRPALGPRVSARFESSARSGNCFLGIDVPRPPLKRYDLLMSSTHLRSRPFAVSRSWDGRPGPRRNQGINRRRDREATGDAGDEIGGSKRKEVSRQGAKRQRNRVKRNRPRITRIDANKPEEKKIFAMPKDVVPASSYSRSFALLRGQSSVCPLREFFSSFSR